MQKQTQRRQGKFTLLPLLLITLLLIAAPLRIASAQGQSNSASPAEVSRLKVALSAALDRVEDDNDKISKASAYIDSLEKEKTASDRLLDANKAELASLVRLRALDKEESDKLRAAIDSLTKENVTLGAVIAKQNDTIVKQNAKISFTKKLAAIGTILGLAAGFYFGSKR